MWLVANVKNCGKKIELEEVGTRKEGVLVQSFTFPMKALPLFSCTGTDALPLLAKELKERERKYFDRERKRNDQIEEEPIEVTYTR